MNQLAQAKKEAKRLYSLAKNNPQSELHIPSLSHAQKIVAFMNGYNNWHDFEQNLNKKDNLKEFNTSKNLISNIVEYLPSSIEKNLNNYHVQPSMNNLLHYSEKAPTFDLNIKNQGLGGTIGTTIIKGKFSSKEYKVPLWPRNTTYWGMNGSGLYTSLESFVYQVINKDSGIIYFNGESDPYIYSKLYLVCETCNRINDLFCLNFNAQNKKQTHTIDPINPMIRFKDNFLIMFGMTNSMFSEIFYELCFYCYQNNIAIDSNTLINLMSLNNLINYENHVLQEVFSSQSKDIENYLNSLNTEHNNTIQLIQAHHMNVQNALIYCEVIKKYESLGMFSYQSQIDLEMIVSQSKILLVLCPKENNTEINHLMTTYLLTMQSLAFKKAEGNIIGEVFKLSGYLTINVFDNIGSIFNPITWTLFEKNLNEQKGKRIVNIIASQDYSSGLKATTVKNIPNIHSFNEVLSHFEQHMLMKVENSQSIPPIIIQKIVSECENFENIFYKNSTALKDLKVAEGYYFYKHERDVDEKFKIQDLGSPRKGFLKKVNTYYHYIKHRNQENLIINHEIIRK